MKFKLFLFENSNQKDLKYLGEIEFTEEDTKATGQDFIIFEPQLLTKLNTLIKDFESK